MVDVHPKYSTSDEKGYAQMRCFATRDGKAGFAITKDGDLVSVFSDPSKKNSMGKILAVAVAHGARKLDCYGGGLQNLYGRYGAKATGRTNFLTQYAPPGWPGGKDNKHQLVAMILPRTVREIASSYDRTRKTPLNRIRKFQDYDRMIANRNYQLRQQDNAHASAIRNALGGGK